MNQMPLSCSNAYMEGFIKTCADLNLDADTSATLLQTQQRNDLFTNSAAYREAFKSAMVKQAGVFGTIGKGLDWAGGGLLKGLGVAGKGLWRAKAPLGIAGGIGGGRYGS